jgi:putative membrane protein
VHAPAEHRTDAPIDEARDATRRTRLANERTYLAWWRTGLTAFAVSIGSGKLIPELTSGTTWPYTVIGIGFAVLGIACCVYAYRRHHEVDAALRRGEFAGPDDRMVVAMSAIGALLGLVLVIVLLAQS